TENRKPKTENRKPKTENRKPKTENRKPKTENQRLETIPMNQKGFTLIEIMVVMFLIALTVGIVSVNFRHDTSQVVETEARRFIALVEQMCQESIIQGRVFAVAADGATAYSFVSLVNGNWVPVADDDIFYTRQLPEEISITIALQEPRQKADKKDEKDRTYLHCEPDGFMPPFSAVFDLEEVRYRVETNEMHKMEIKVAE
ncbi:MAG: pilus assembly FimT family protein, partial [Arenicellales bacterium]